MSDYGRDQVNQGTISCILQSSPGKMHRHAHNVESKTKNQTLAICSFCHLRNCQWYEVTINQLTFPDFQFETEAKVDFPSACISQRCQNFEQMFSILNRALSWAK